MDDKKQIEEMANIILQTGDDYNTKCREDCETIASLFYNAGYRKQRKEDEGK